MNWTYDVTRPKKDDEVLEIDEEAVENYLWKLLFLVLVYLLAIFVAIGCLALLLLDLGGHMEDFIDDFE